MCINYWFYCREIKWPEKSHWLLSFTYFNYVAQDVKCPAVQSTPHSYCIKEMNWMIGMTCEMFNTHPAEWIRPHSAATRHLQQCRTLNLGMPLPCFWHRRFGSRHLTKTFLLGRCYWWAAVDIQTNGSCQEEEWSLRRSPVGPPSGRCTKRWAHPL